MTDQKIPALPEITVVDDLDDIYVVDVSDTTDDPTGSSKFVKAKNSLGTPRTAAEITAGVTPTDFRKDPGEVLRYGTNTTPGTTDMTTPIANAFAASAGANKVIFPPEILLSDPITVPSNTHAVFSEGTILKANTGFGANDRLLSFASATNVVFECNGARFRMIKSEYTTGEQRHCFLPV